VLRVQPGAVLRLGHCCPRHDHETPRDSTHRSLLDPGITGS
jgi:hypothetical protein